DGGVFCMSRPALTYEISGHYNPAAAAPATAWATASGVAGAASSLVPASATNVWVRVGGWGGGKPMRGRGTHGQRREGPPAGGWGGQSLGSACVNLASERKSIERHATPA